MNAIAACAAVGALWFGGAWGGGARSAEPTLQDLAFLAGAWEMAEGDEFMREVWDEARGDAMVGHFSIIEAGHATLYELLAIEEGEDGVVMRLRHFGPGLTPWASEASGPLAMPLKEVGAGRAVFADPAREFPTRVVYERAEDRLTVRLEPSEESEREEIVVTFERVE